MKKLVILKFGGTSMGDYVSVGKNLPHLVKIIKRYQKEFENVVVVCSALAGETRRLKATADGLGLNAKERDRVLAHGESYSSSLLGDFLVSCGVKAEVLGGEKLPILTNSVFGRADIKDVDVKAINQSLKKGNVVIVPGFIGRDKNGDFTTLGFDGSDTTAVSIASWMKADKVCLFKDVNGIYSANPKKAKAQKYDEISLDDMYIFARCGAMIVHPKAIQTALQNKFDIHIIPTFGDGAGSIITNKCPSKDIIGVGYYEDNNGEITVSVVGNDLKSIKDRLVKKFKEKGIDIELKDDNKSSKHIDFRLNKKEQLDGVVKLAHRLCGLDMPDFTFVSNLKDKDQISYDPSLKSTEHRSYKK
ncbi:MAG: hypothetical protein LBL47_01675 [Lactobacillus sp.]|jgi:aspartate kinase|nr:hypothetical protein [Lactobacillus sp.]